MNPQQCSGTHLICLQGIESRAEDKREGITTCDQKTTGLDRSSWEYLTPNEVQALWAKATHSRNRIRPLPTHQSVPVKWTEGTEISGWASLDHLGSEEALVSLTFSFMPAIRAQERSNSAPQKAGGIKPSICGPARLPDHSPHFLMGEPAKTSQRCCLTAHWHTASEKCREGETRTRPGRRRFPGPR